MNGQVRIDEMFAFIVVDTDGTEGIPAVNTADNMIMPLVGGDMKRIESLKKIVEDLGGFGKPYKIVKFSKREVLEEIEVKEKVDA